VEGQLNERICASALYYYDCENITKSYLAFRERTDNQMLEWHLDEDSATYENGDLHHIEWLFGVKNRTNAATQMLGRVLTNEGRLLVFPNVLQHRVEPFKLADPTKPGHRKILALFLVDPHVTIPSTANVPPQQRHWWADMIRGLDRIGDLPPEIVDRIVEYSSDFTLTNEEAKELRLELMEERSKFVDSVNDALESNKYSFCEH